MRLVAVAATGGFALAAGAVGVSPGAVEPATPPIVSSDGVGHLRLGTRLAGNGRRRAAGARPTMALGLSAPMAEAAASGAVDASLPPITVSSPRPYAHVRSPMLVRGTANVFEANVTVILKDSKGRVLARRFTTATCGTGCRGSYRVHLHFRVPKRQPGYLDVQDDDAAVRGYPPHRVRVPLTLLP